jgi:predicted RNase H-like nuclease (RuvC/YqgF family)
MTVAAVKPREIRVLPRHSVCFIYRRRQSCVEEARVRTAVSEAAQQDVIAAIGALVQSLQTERQRLARRLDDMERELQALAGRLNACEPRLGDIRSHASLR